MIIKDFIKILKSIFLTVGFIFLPWSTSFAKSEHMHGHGHHQQQSGYGSMMYMKDHVMPEGGMLIEPPGAPSDSEVEYKEYDMNVEIVHHEIVPGITVPMFAFNAQVPAPEFHVFEGDWVKVTLHNNTDEMHTIHWHGLVLPYTMDGVPMVTQDPVHPGDTFVYRFKAQPAGTRWYHCHWGTPLHAGMMHGAFIIHKRDDPLKNRFPYTREYVLLLESWDVGFIREEMNGLMEGMKQLNLLMKQGKFDHRIHGFFQDYHEFKDSISEKLYVPPYIEGRTSGIKVEPNFFGINGKSFPSTKRIAIRKNEWIRVRIISASNSPHHMHLHGHDFWWVAQDGNDLDIPRKVNTVHVNPGGTYDIMIYGDNPGFWVFHDHNTRVVRNNGIYPGGMLTMLAYEDVSPTYSPTLSMDQ